MSGQVIDKGTGADASATKDDDAAAGQNSAADTTATNDTTSQDDDAGDDAKTGEKSLDLPAALAALEEAKRKIREVNRESADRRKKITELEKLTGGTTKKDADTTELTAIQAQLVAANEKLRVIALRDRFETVIAKAKMPFISPVAIRDAFTLALDATSKLPEDASDDDFLDIIKDVVKVRPHLLNKPIAPNINSDSKGATDALAGLDLNGIASDFGMTIR